MNKTTPKQFKCIDWYSNFFYSLGFRLLSGLINGFKST